MNKKSKLIKAYYDFFDSKLSDSSIVVWLIWLLIILVWFFAWNINGSLIKSNINEYREVTFSRWIENVIIIDWKRYKVILEEIK